MSESDAKSDALTTSLDSLLIKSSAKPKRKNSEKRKEKSRKAARERRSQESKIFDQMEALLPIPTKTINHLDKASLIRLAINYLKIRKVIEPIKIVSNFKTESEPYIEDYSAAKALNGFLLVLSKEGDMVYLSENVDKYLGLNQIDLIGQSIYDFSHPCDHNDIKDILALKNMKNCDESNDHKSNPMFGSIFVRMKCTLTNKGRNLNLKSANYKVIHCSGHLKSINDSDETPEAAECLTHTSTYYMITICEPIDQPMSVDMPFSCDVFISRHSLDMKYTQVDDSINKIIGYNSEELTGKSLFNFFHALDLQQLEKFFKTRCVVLDLKLIQLLIKLFSKGQSHSNYYRFLAKSGGYLWLLTQATLTTDTHSSQPQSVVCVNHVISGIVNEREIVSEEQCFEKSVENARLLPQLKPAFEETSTRAQTPFVSSTKTVFAPKTADMDSGFIVFDNANHMTYLSDPEDLTHLAPEATGDDFCVPFPGLLAEFNELNFFEEVFLNQNVSNANLLSEGEKVKFNEECLQHMNAINMYNSNDDLNETFIKPNDNTLYKTITQNFVKSYPAFRDADSVEDSPLPNDPLLSYHEEMLSSSSSADSSDPYSSETNSPLNISSPILSQTSNFFCKSPTEEVSKLNINEKNDLLDDKVLEMRAPYIPIDEDFPLLLEEGLQMNYSNANIDEFIPFDNISGDKPLNASDSSNKYPMFENPLPQKSNCLELLLQKDLKQKSPKNVTNGYSKYSNIDRSDRQKSSNVYNINNNSHKSVNVKSNANHRLGDGQDMR
ncbi:unnamed protein product [Oppiella nova]|uniref:Hypoxia-inducible factor 1-alpha n=1 Tax=Oppiella nova TaxID=334625 RepID=A0A7R9QD85_9ACAR|nr:unnamed protein product [Oppiella nova]CAG2163483.1 unnamed protein product [Oppiella nova]